MSSGRAPSGDRRHPLSATGEETPRWGYKHVHAKRMKVLSVADEFTREALALVPARSLTASAVKGVHARLLHGLGKTSRYKDNGPKFIAFELIE